MFSLLAQGKATWDGGIEFGEKPSETDMLLPLWLMRLPTSPYKSCSKLRGQGAASTGSLFEDGQIVLPKTFVTRKGAILLFTPTVTLQEHQPQVGETVQCFPDVFDDNIKLGTVANFANTVLHFGKEPNEKNSSPMKDNKKNQERTTKDKQAAFLKFLHYLDSDNRQDNRLTRPGCDQGFYLDKLKEKTRCESSKAHFDSHVGVSEDGLSDMISDYLRLSVSNPELKLRPLKTSELKHIMECSEDFEKALSPRHFTKLVSSRPHTAPIPPQPKSPRANPRITSAKTSTTRALGSTTCNLEAVLRADIGCCSRQDTSPLAITNVLHDASCLYSVSTKQGAVFSGNTSRPTPETPFAPFEEHPKIPDAVDGEDAMSLKSVMHQGYRPFSPDLSKGSGSTNQLMHECVPSAGASKETSKQFGSFARSEIQSTGCSTSATSHISQLPSTAKLFDSEGSLSSLHHASEASDRHKVVHGGFDGRNTSVKPNSEKNSLLSRSVQSETSHGDKIEGWVIDEETLRGSSPSPWFTDESKVNQQDRESEGNAFAKSGDTIGTIESEDDLNELTENMVRSKYSDYLLLDDVLRSKDSPEEGWPPLGVEDCRSEAEDPHDEIETARYENCIGASSNAQRRMTGESDSSHLCASADEIHVTLIQKNTEQTHFDISRSRPTSAIDRCESNQDLSVTEAVKQFIQEDHRTQSRLSQSSARSHGWFEDIPVESMIDHEIAKSKVASESENRLKVFH